MSDSDTREKDKSLHFLDIHDLLLNPIDPDYLVDGLIEDHTTGALIGESGSGKTFIAASLACSVATGISFAGCQIKKQGLVIYFAYEGQQGFPRRIQGWEIEHKTTIPPGRFFMPCESVQLDLAGAKRIEAATCELAETYGSPVLLVIDTLVRALPAGRDENSSKDMMAFLNIIDRLRDRYNCVALIVHHTGHGEESKGRARGSSSFRAAMDWEFLVDKRKGLLRATKMKDSDLPDPIRYEISKSSESAVVAFGDTVSEKTQSLNNTERFGLRILKETFIRVGRQTATTEEWREDFYHEYKNTKNDNKRKAFNRSLNGLVAKGILEFKNESYSLAGQLGQLGQNGTSPDVSRIDSGTNGTPPYNGCSHVPRPASIIKGAEGDRGRDPP